MNPAFIIDCSLTMSWCFADEATAESSALLNRLATEAVIVPQHWPLEVSNVLVMAEKRSRISTSDATRFVTLLGAFQIQVDDATASNAFAHTLPLARLHGLTSYDAAYLELAIRLGLPLATLDDDLRRAGQSLGVVLLGK
jgi:predicted nucleic acid-binding protein